MANKARLWVWEPQALNWWVAVLFMIGAALFALGCVMFLASVEHELLLDGVFFLGSIFFTSAAYCQLHQSLTANKILFWSALSQFIGALMFNMNTFDAFFNLDWLQQDLLIWTPNILGSILFQISGTLAMRDICGKWWCWDNRSIGWWIEFINFIGCVAFLISAVFSFVIPTPVPASLAIWATILTLIGAVCFFVGAYFMWPEMAARED